MSDDWSDQSSYIWSERNGRKYLLDVSKETERFYSLYIRTRHIANHLDFIFANMHWKHLASHVRNLNGGPGSNVSIITFHCNPLNIAFSSIFGFVENIFEISMKSECPLSTLVYFKLYQLTNKVVLNQQEGMYSMDSGDYVLAVCHLKNVVSTINEIMSMLTMLKSNTQIPKGKALDDFFKDYNIALFDLRELAWQAILFCNSLAEN